ncbi:MAG: restriction endonuclease [Thaumarchaeota archaeon]|nr:restriction endonuclease [Nitrososphaerota archaeon]
MDLVAELVRVAGPKRGQSILESTAEEMGVRSDSGDRALVALALCQSGWRPEDVAKHLSWKEFEAFCSKLFRASGYEVTENVVLIRPRVQIDMVARGRSHLLSVDCKHWKRSHSPSVLMRFARDQLRRSDLLRKRIADPNPIVSVILSFSEPSGSFAEGVAVVPLGALRSFLDSVESYSEFLSLR